MPFAVDTMRFNTHSSEKDIDCLLYIKHRSEYDVSNVINMSAMFAGAFRFNQPLISWNVFRVQFFQNFRSGSSLSTPNTPVRFVFAA